MFKTYRNFLAIVISFFVLWGSCRYFTNAITWGLGETDNIVDAIIIGLGEFDIIPDVGGEWFLVLVLIALPITLTAFYHIFRGK